MDRVLSRRVARELSPEELTIVSGANYCCTSIPTQETNCVWDGSKYVCVDSVDSQTQCVPC